MSPVNFCRVPVQVSNHRPQVRKHAWLVLIGRFNRLSIFEDIFVFRRKELGVFLPHYELFESVNKLVLFGDFVLLLHKGVQNVEHVRNALLIQLRLDVQVQFALARILRQLVLHDRDHREVVRLDRDRFVLDLHHKHCLSKA